MTQNKSVEEVAQAIQDLYFERGATVDMPSWTETMKLLSELRQTSQEREREIVGKLFEALDYQNTERELNAKEEDRMGIKLALQQFKLKFLTEYNITLTNPNKD